jgi:hypothetical protein
MTANPSEQSNPQRNRDDNWAAPIDRIKVSEVPAGATNLNVEGREVVSPMQGFGPVWKKTYKLPLTGVKATPAEVMAVWKANFPKFQPPENQFYPPMAGVKPGEVLFISATLPAIPGVKSFGIPVSAGVMVLYADDEMFTVMTPAGFPEAGWNTFSAFEEDGTTFIQVQSMARTADPIYEMGFRFMGGAKQQEKIWVYVLTQVAQHFGVTGTVVTNFECLDPSLQWRQSRNVWHNAIIRTTFYKLGAPFRWVAGRFRRSS